MSVRLQKSVSLLADSGEFSYFLAGMVPELLHFAHFFLCLGKPSSVVLGGYFYARAPLCILWGVTIYFWHRSLDICCLFLQCEQAVITSVLSVFPGRRRQWVELVVSAWLLCS